MFDIIKSNSIIRPNFLSKLKTAARISKTDYFWIEFDNSNIDLAWQPPKHDREYIHVFGSDLNHIQAIFANKEKLKQLEQFSDFKLHTIENCNFEQNIIEVDGPISTELLFNLQEKQDTEWFWVVNKYFDYSEIDFTWREDPWTNPKLYAYGNSEQGYKAYLLHKKTDVYGETVIREHKFKHLYEKFDSESIIRKNLLQKLRTAARISQQDHVWISHRNHNIDPYWFPDQSEANYIHVFGSDLNHIQAIWFNKNTVKNLKKFENFKLHICDVKNYHNVVHLAKNIEVSDLKELQTAMSDEWIWIVESHYDYSKFDFTWRPDPWNDYNWYNFNNKAYLIHQFSDLDKVYDLRNEKFNRVTVPIIQIDTLQNGTGIKYKNYADAIKQAIQTAPYSLFWLVANHIDTSKFDFTWFPEYSDLNYLHCWATGEQDKGDLFFVNKDSINLEHDDLFKMAEIKFHDSNIPAVKYNVTGDYTDDLPKLIKETEFNLPWNFVRNMDSELNVKWQWPQPCYWYGPRIETYGDNNSVILYHKDVVKEIKTEIYDFPTIIKNRRLASYDKKLDVIFLSNEEYFAQSNLMWLKSVCPRAKHIRGVTGRANSYKAMAQASRTQWFFAVFSKLHVAKDFDFDWRPDRLQAPKHYIFKATNTMNGLEYGHMAIVAANKNIVLNQTDYELDFTMSGAHTVVDINSGVAYFNESPMATWRTAFRECVKLTHAIQQNSLDMESFDRLNVWMTRADGHYADYCLMGANDGYEYAKKNEGNLDALKLTREWDWLEKYFIDRHSRRQP